MSRYGTRFALSDTALAEVAAQRGREVDRLRRQLAEVERERDEARRALEKIVEVGDRLIEHLKAARLAK